MSSLSLLYGSDVALLSFWKKRKKEAKIGEKGQKEQKCEDRQHNKEDRRDTEEWKKEKNIRQGIGQRVQTRQRQREKRHTNCGQYKHIWDLGLCQHLHRGQHLRPSYLLLPWGQISTIFLMGVGVRVGWGVELGDGAGSVQEGHRE